MSTVVPKPKVWGNQNQNVTTSYSLSDIMSEQLVNHLQQEEDKFLAVSISDQNIEDQITPKNKPDDSAVSVDSTMNPEDSDFAIAQMLQMEFERERDESILLYEKSRNKDSKINISYQNYRNTDHISDRDCEVISKYESHAYNDHLEDSDQDINKSDSTQNTKKKKKRTNKDPLITKHDLATSGKNNIIHTQNLNCDIAIGNLYDTKYDFKLSNKVYNGIKVFAKKEGSHAFKLKEKKDFSTRELAVDANTRLQLFKLIDSGTLNEVTGVIATGKEAVIAHAFGGYHEKYDIPQEVAIKIFKTTLTEFKSREKYIKDDYRFKARLRKQNPRKIIKAWVEKERHNLKRFKACGVSVPQIYLQKKNALVMEFIGKNRMAAPQLKHASSTMTEEELKSAYDQCIEGMRTLYQKGRLIHADLSQFNLLWWESTLYFIDVSQSVEPSHPNAHYFLNRDCTNISNFFNKCGIDALSPIELFNFVTNLNVSKDSLEVTLIKMNFTSDRSSTGFLNSESTTAGFEYLYDEMLKLKESEGASDNSDSSSDSELDEDNADSGSNTLPSL